MTVPALPPSPCYLNGEFSTIDKAKVSVMDRGFIFGDGVYEVVPVYRGRPFRFAEHMARLDRSLAELRIERPMSHEDLGGLVQELVQRFAAAKGVPSSQTDQIVYLQVTRGVAMRDHVMPPGIAPTVFAMTNPLYIYPPEAREQGIDCITADDFRWKKGHVKSISLAGAVLARQLSADEGAAETVMFRDGFLTEGSGSNIWVVKGGQVLGAPRDNLVLEGIRYGLIGELCAQQGIPFQLRRISREEVLGADELLVSSATKEILPCTRLDGRPVGNGRPGPIYQKLYAGYQQAKQAS